MKRTQSKIRQIFGKIATVTLIVASVSVLATWRHWYWRAPQAEVSLGGIVQKDARVYRATNGWRLIDVRVGSRRHMYVYDPIRHRVGETDAGVLENLLVDRGFHDIWTTSLISYSVDSPPIVDDIDAAELKYDPKITILPRGVTFLVVENSDTSKHYWMRDLKLTW